MKLKNRIKSKKLYEECLKVIPSGVNSPARSFSEVNTCPLVIDSAKGDLIFDVDGNSYIDFCGAWGSLIFGHCPDFVVQETIKQVKLGTSFGTVTPFEEKIARLIVETYKSVDKVRFVSSGTEATMTAIRIARGYTGKKLIVKFSGNYHGHNDCLLMESGSSASDLDVTATSSGIPVEVISNTISLDYNNLSQLETFFDSEKSDQIAAVIIEPIAGNMGLIPAEKEFLSQLRYFCTKKESLLIFDEVITGFRASLEGAQGLYDIYPDITCFGKIIGGGFPAAAVGGKEQIMDVLAPKGKVFQAGTLSGNPVAMRAGYITLKALLLDGIYEELESKTKAFLKPIQEFIIEKDLLITINQIGSMFTIFFGSKNIRNKIDLNHLNNKLFKQFFLFMLEKGIYFPQSPYETSFVSIAHEEKSLLKTSEAILNFLKINYE